MATFPERKVRTEEGRQIWEQNRAIAAQRTQRFLEWLEAEGGVHYGLRRCDIAQMLGMTDSALRALLMRLTKRGIIKIDSGGTRGNGVVVPSRYLLRMTWAQYVANRDEIDVAARKAAVRARRRAYEKVRKPHLKEERDRAETSRVVFDAAAELAADELLALAAQGADLTDDEIAAWS